VPCFLPPPGCPPPLLCSPSLHDALPIYPEILAAFLGQFYEDKPIPRLILSNVRPHELELLEEAFSMKANRKIEIVRPQRGEKLRSEEHTSELQSRENLVCRLLLRKKKER